MKYFITIINSFIFGITLVFSQGGSGDKKNPTYEIPGVFQEP